MASLRPGGSLTFRADGDWDCRMLKKGVSRGDSTGCLGQDVRERTGGWGICSLKQFERKGGQMGGGAAIVLPIALRRTRSTSCSVGLPRPLDWSCVSRRVVIGRPNQG